MNKRAAIAIIALASAVVGYRAYSTAEAVPATVPQPEAAWFTCAQSEECVTVQGGLCKWAAVNSAHAQAFGAYITQTHHLDRIEYDCPAEFKAAPKPAAHCVDQRCAIEEVAH